jgi:polysaccharide export outer membrane protein
VGLTTTELEEACQTALVHELRDPKVAVALAFFGSQSVSILGAVNQPGTKQLEGHKTLFEILSMASGLRPDAGYQIRVTRDLRWGPIPLPQAKTDTANKTSVASIKVRDLLIDLTAAENIQMMPDDTISVPVTDRVYAVGCVTKPGAFEMNDHEFISALQVVSLAEGATKTAALSKAKILRAVPGSPTRIEIAVNLKEIMKGQGTDVQLQPDDILFVPNSNPKSAAFRTIDAIVAASGYAAVRAAY